MLFERPAGDEVCASINVNMLMKDTPKEEIESIP
jgi:hypothetical protein